MADTTPAVEETVPIEQDAPEKNHDSVPDVALTREAILALASQKQRVVRVEVPEWGGYVLVRALTGKQRDAFELSQLEGKGTNRKVNLSNMRAKLVSFSIVNEQGKRMFSDEDTLRLGDLSAKALTRVYRVASDLSGLSDEDVEELTAALGEGQSESSGSN